MKPTVLNTPNSNLLELEHVSFSYPDGGIGLDDCTLIIRHGSRNALIGANGSGKTTLFQHCNGLLQPQSGLVRYDGEAIDYGRKGLRQLRSKVGMVFQNPDRQLFSASVQEDVSFGPFNLGLAESAVRQRVAAALLAVGMEAFANKAVHNLSYGEKKRVCIAGVLAMEPELLVLDEPMAGLDQRMQEELLIVLDELHERGITLLLATHDIDFAYRWADRLHLISAGRCTATLEAADLADCGDALSAVGLPLPKVVELHNRLMAKGALSNERTPRTPRTHGELLALL
ncbi:ABC transporter ATP-binding protein [Propionivibrio sp.]|uniref:energy-coupling factor ABC transporter ATP-binding protein n=1 Tax=Propionivibrio sp. TaxID=2212460 RepID=UPI0025CD22D3|nr:ABC transporter ATP-binding protein [Propionivibrio sp.]MBK7354914.1 ABC transporter ATP-binding protein [Propionivibrio sp.]MBK8402283.1 ABC transporter ATP-binding protein [Propionivibrio sp.]MBK8743441.1 ABC transporter ATP-binding protein [Propionivibrio sp.]MBK8892744.1 ABC transporter ATP-binding protein [Propionivibrio sp.]